MKTAWRDVLGLMKTVWPVLGVLIGALITWYFSWHYYMKASDDLTRASKDLLQVNESLKKQTDRIIRMNTIGLSVLEEKGYVKLNRDAKGNIVGKIIELKAKIPATASTSEIEWEDKPGE